MATIDLEDAPSVLALVPQGNVVADPWRIQEPIEALQLQGYPVAWRHVPPEALDLLRQLTTDGYRPDILLFQKGWLYFFGAHFDGAVTAWLATMRRLGTVLISDVDDNEFDSRDRERSVSDRPPSALEAGRRARVGALRAVDGITASTPVMAAAVRQHVGPGTPIRVLPNAIAAPRYLAARRATTPHQGVTIGWAGTRRRAADLGALPEAWVRIAARYPDVDFVTIGFPGGAFDALPPGRLVDRGGVHPARYPDALATLDIACCALVRDWFNECKSPQKAWEHALCGAAVVASPCVYGDDPGFAEHGGLLAEGVDEWEHHLSRLIEHEEERRARADALAAWVVAEHTLEGNLWRWPAAWRAIADQAARRPVATLLPGGGQAGADRARQKAKARAKRRR